MAARPPCRDPLLVGLFNIRLNLLPLRRSLTRWRACSGGFIRCYFGCMSRLVRLVLPLPLDLLGLLDHFQVHAALALFQGFLVALPYCLPPLLILFLILDALLDAVLLLLAGCGDLLLG